ncbi:MAG: right-handed parallel beta-helix repeat-containing protein [Bacteroidales bacterium]|nr:right-handed parallel beta-helix repeat-containing protein [Bacteroidales bacterium]MDD4213594.1 right-handed parallel beta-helix repeat-containing protein [Bacteroidales bacterium]
MRKLLLIFLFACCTKAFAVDFIVTNTNDNGTGSLRNAIIQANASPSGSHQILFNIPTSDINFNSTQGTWTILPLSAMPYITKGNISIDGTSQTINQGNTNSNGPEIILDGNRTVDFAFHIFNVSNVIIKGFVICNFTYGIQISQMTANASQYNVIKGNYIGTNYNASDTAGNSIGIEIIGGPQYNTIGGTQIADRNIVSGNNHIGIRIVNANNNIIINNYVGTDRTGTYALRNYDGISIEGTAKYNVIGGYTVAERNLVSGNVAYGIPVFGAGCDNNVIIGNYIGSDISGSYKIPNTYGVLYDDGAKFNLLGGKKQGAGNLISGNSGYGVFIYNNSTNSDTVTGNLIGTTANGMDSLSNTIGIVIDGIPRYHIVDSNVISGNRQSGIVIHATGTDYNVITRNKIGTAIDGISPLPNELDGIRIGEGPRKNIIGMPGKGNIIAFNKGNGITIMNDGDYYNKISANSIHHNAGLGIDLYPMGITNNDASDADIGPNMLMNFPVITSAEYNEASGKFLIEGYIDTQLSQYTTIELFKSDDDASGFGEGEIYLASVVPDNTGNFSVEITSGIWGGTKVTATATDSSGNTSEFSASTHVSKVPVFIFNEEKIHVFPNPAINNVYIILTNYIGNIQLNILNLQGEKIFNESFPITCRYFVRKIDVSNFESGIYFVVILNDEGNHSFIIAVLK